MNKVFIAVLTGLAFVSSAGIPGMTSAHGPEGHQGQGMGPGMMMGQGMHPGMMMGRGMGSGMMGQGMMHPGMMSRGMMGQGMGPGIMMGPGMMGQGTAQPLARDLTAKEVRHMMEHRLAWRNNPNLKIGKVEEKDKDTIIAEIVTKDDSLVQRFKVDRHTGWMQPIQ